MKKVLFIILFTFSFLFICSDSCGKNPCEGFIKDEYYLFISNEIKGTNLDSILPFAILLTENTSLDPNAKSKPNRNGSVDLGLFQINSLNLEYFEEMFWNGSNFDIMNWQHNSVVAVGYINHLYDRFDGDLEKTAAAYNCGPGRVANGNIPDSTKKYVEKVMTNYYCLARL